MDIRLILTPETTLQEAIQKLDDTGQGVLPVVNENGDFIGLITDGDIRKAILNNALDLDHIVNRNPFTMSIDSTRQDRINYLHSVVRRHLPLLDDTGKYVDLFILGEDDFNFAPNRVVVMAGGLGSRLGKLTEDVPKPMLTIGRKPMLENIMKHFLENGFNKFYFSVNYRKEMIIDYFGDGSKWGADIRYLIEETRLGTGGPLSLIDEEVQHPLLVVNGDVLTTLDARELLDFHEKSNSDATMCVVSHQVVFPYGVVRSNEGALTSFEEKPELKFDINAGIYVINGENLSLIPKNTYFDMPSLFERMLELNQRPFVYKPKGAWVDVGRLEDYNDVNEAFARTTL